MTITKASFRLPLIRKIVNPILIAMLAFAVFSIPALRMSSGEGDDNLAKPGISRFAEELFENLTPKYEAWAIKRVASAKAAGMDSDLGLLTPTVIIMTDSPGERPALAISLSE